MGSGGCATSTETSPAKLATQKVKSIAECYGVCKTKDNCRYFEYETLYHNSADPSVKGINCHMLSNSDIDQGNGLYRKYNHCYKMDVDGKLLRFISIFNKFQFSI